MPKDRGTEQGDVDGTLKCTLALGVVAAQATSNLPCFLMLTTPQTCTACEQATQSDSRKPPTSSWRAQKTSPEPTTRCIRCRKWRAGLWCMDDGDILCHPILVPSYQEEFDIANAKVGPEWNPKKAEVIYDVDDLDAAPPSEELMTCRTWPKSPQLHSETLSGVDSTSRTSAWPRQTSFGKYTNVFCCVRTGTQNLLSNVRVLASVASTTLSSCTATRPCRRNELQK